MKDFTSGWKAELADPSEGVKRSLRRPTFGGFGAQADARQRPRRSACGGRAGS